jgi:hypothetical protein
VLAAERGIELSDERAGSRRAPATHTGCASV